MHSIYFLSVSIVFIGFFHSTNGLFYNPPPPPPPPQAPPFIYGTPGQLSPQDAIAIARAEWTYRNTLYLNNPFFNTNNPFYINPYGSYFPPTLFRLYTLSNAVGTRPTERPVNRRTTPSGEDVTEDGEEEDDGEEFTA